MTAYLVLQAATLIALFCLCSGLQQLNRNVTRALKLLQESIDATQSSSSRP